jgi:hypothetical protein
MHISGGSGYITDPVAAGEITAEDTLFVAELRH